ncbi:centrosomal protein of 112 kDa isoform X2 [Protopterus annectens]|uniref:centrosomal protein of 112 kDa isoform X2 n=1 Tax=Protopterus annectens TaxID=7888 RepID=UPI001CF93F34|nr:centrosomal protein of 112 kDa isoform X2 [Protopterus annectens]
MTSQEQTWEDLDSEFDHYLVDMKPWVLKLTHKPDRQRCALWIKKLCEPSGAGTGITGRKNRNMYAKLLLHMVRRGVIEGPFAQRPEPGMLKTLPTYMSIYFDEPRLSRVQSSFNDGVPDWVTGELGAENSPTDDSWKKSPKENLTSRQAHRRRYTYGEKLKSQMNSSAHTTKSEGENAASDLSGNQHKNLVSSSDDSDLEARLNSWNLGIENPRYLREKPLPLSPISPKTSLGKISSFRDDQALVRMHEKEIEMKTKMLEAKFHEEKLKMQQKHDADVQKILDRKNNEIEDLKILYRGKQTESEEMVKNLEKKVQSLIRESQVIRESKEKQIAELKKMSEQSSDSLKNEWEKKLLNAVAEMEQEKFTLQKKHTENIQELLDETNSRLSKMEAEYAAQSKATNQMVKELESRVQQLSVEAENSSLLRQKLSQEKADLDKLYQSTHTELMDIKTRYSSLQREKDRLIEEYEEKIRQIQSKSASDVNFMMQEQALSAAKASGVIEELEYTISQLKQQVQDVDHQKQQHLRDLESKFQHERLQQEHIHEKKIHSLQSEMEKERAELQKRIRKLEECLREKEDQLTRVTEVQRQQAQQADTALEEFKKQVELNSEKVYADMKQQMEKVEADLSRSKCLREKQSKEFIWQLEELKQRYEQQIVELKLEHEQEKTHLFQQHNAEKDNLVQDHEREIEKLEKQLRAAMLEHENKTQEWRKRDAQTIAELEAQVHHLREEVIQINSQRKQQLVELGLLREEEKQKAARDHEATVSKLRTEMERIKLEMQRAHTAETELTLEKAAAELQSTISSLREENSRLQINAERQLQDSLGRFEEERRQLIRDHDKAIKTLQEEMENCRNQLRCTEKKLQHRGLETQEQITHVRQEYEMKIKGLMPTSLRQELEDTISSLKSQVNFLQKRASVLQEELNTYRNRK